MGPTTVSAEDLLIITGSMGSGKTTVMAEASDLLKLQGIPHAAIDLDALGVFHLSAEAEDSSVACRNLKCVWENYSALGLRRLLLASAIENRLDLASCRAAVAAKRTVTCRLIASVETMQQRVRSREPGILQHEFVARVVELNSVLDRAQVEDFSIANEASSVTKVAREMLVRAGWL
jgi:hypothetical protein